MCRSCAIHLDGMLGYRLYVSVDDISVGDLPVDNVSVDDISAMIYI